MCVEKIEKWPRKRSKQLHILQRLSTRFEFNEKYSESEVNAIILDAILGDDYALFRRELCVSDFLRRTSNGEVYWRSEDNGGDQ